ncbi:MAG: TauD/TfdA family dioxygenase [Magnetovibrio sp.]|nr:TauD/TfdA family dioxygenase [Magnetovibrio sp.]
MDGAASITVRPFDAGLGAEIAGLDLSVIDADGFAVVRAALDRHFVLRLRGQTLSEPELIRFGQMFGELDPPGPNPYGRPINPDHPELNVISNVKADDGVPIGNLGDGEAVWHQDMTYIETPPKCAVLYGVEVPVGQGDTHFANLFDAYDALDDGLKARIDGKRAIHDASHNSAGMLRKGYEEIDDVTRTPGARQPLVLRHPASGRKCLCLGRRPRSYVPGLTIAESDTLLDALWAHATQPRFTWVQEWRPGDVLIWDNLSVLHRRDAFDGAARRILHRVQIKGDAPPI